MQIEPRKKVRRAKKQGAPEKADDLKQVERITFNFTKTDGAKFREFVADHGMGKSMSDFGVFATMAYIELFAANKSSTQ